MYVQYRIKQKNKCYSLSRNSENIHIICKNSYSTVYCTMYIRRVCPVVSGRAKHDTNIVCRSCAITYSVWFILSVVAYDVCQFSDYLFIFKHFLQSQHIYKYSYTGETSYHKGRGEHLIFIYVLSCCKTAEGGKIDFPKAQKNALTYRSSNELVK